jgi:hypothetical protein
MHADQLQIVLTKKQLQKAILVADDPTARIFDSLAEASENQHQSLPTDCRGRIAPDSDRAISTAF